MSAPSPSTPYIKVNASGPAYWLKWRDSTRHQHNRRLGPAWVVEKGGDWVAKRGTPPPGCLTPTSAVVAGENLKAEVEDDIAANRERGKLPLFKDVAAAWQAHGEAIANWKPSTVRDRKSTVRVHLLPTWGERPAGKIQKDDVRKWWNELHDESRSGGRLSDRNANKVLAEFRACVNWALDQGGYGVIANPADGIKKHKETIGDKPDFFRPAEVYRLSDAARELHEEAAADPARSERACFSRHDWLIFLVCAFTGLRRAEVISLRWHHLNFQQRSIYVVDNLSAKKDARVKDHDARTVPLATALIGHLKAYRPEDGEDGDLLFPGMYGKLDPDALSKRYVEARERAGLHTLTLHDLRHTFGSLAIESGANIIQVQEWMGHADIKTTRRYLHNRSRAEDANLLDAAFSADEADVVPLRRKAA